MRVVTDPVLAIVPARGGSKGIPRKNLRRLGGRPLVARTVDAIVAAGIADRLVVSTEDTEIRSWARHRGHEVVDRPRPLAADAATIAEVARHAADELDWHGVVAVFQPTSPLLSSDTITRALEAFREGQHDSLMTVVRESHLLWRIPAEGEAEPLFSARVNRQWANSGLVRETGAIQLVRAELLRSSGSMIGSRHRLFEVPEDEALDIDSPADLVHARQIVDRATVVFRLRANRAVGAGHLYHCLRLAEELAHHDLQFLLFDCDSFVARILEERGYAWSLEVDLRSDLQRFAGAGGQLVVNDVLDTTEHDVLVQRELGFRVITIEDLGPGARHADWVVNALYVTDDPAVHVAQGARFATLRTEFLDLPPKQVRVVPERVLVTFGGTDPSGLAGRVALALDRAVDAEILVIQGPGAAELQLPGSITVLREVDSMASAMLDSDVVVTSAGRTVHEAAATGTPVVVLAQNAREATHAHLGYDTGVIFLGLGRLVSDEHVAEVVSRVLADADLRAELSQRLRSSIDDHGATRIAQRIDELLGEM